MISIFNFDWLLSKVKQKRFVLNKGNNKITEHRAIFQRERQNSEVNKQTKSANNRKTGKTAIALTWYRHFQRHYLSNRALLYP